LERSKKRAYLGDVSTPDISFNAPLNLGTEDFPSCCAAVTPGLEHLLHLALGRAIDRSVRRQEESGKVGREERGVRSGEVLGDGVEEVERRELLSWRGLTQRIEKNEAGVGSASKLKKARGELVRIPR
jgi:hypothetical protein